MSYNLQFSDDINKRAKDAAVRFCGGRGYEVLDTDCKFDIAARDEDGCIIFIDVFLQRDTEEMPLSRIRIENDMVKELTKHPEWVDSKVRYDTIIVVPIGSKRALIKYHTNAIGSDS